MDRTLLEVGEEYVSAGNGVWDVGANVGVFALASAAIAGPSGFVLAIDGDTWLVDLMRRTCRLESSPRAPIEVLPAAVDSEMGVAKFNIAGRGRAANFLDSTGSTQTGEARERQRVVSVTLDWLLQHFRKPDVLKIDVEGAELRAFVGAKRILSEVRPTIVCEVYKENARQVTDILASHHYTLFDMERLGTTPQVALALATDNIIAVPSRP